MPSLNVPFSNHARRVSRKFGSFLLLAVVVGTAAMPADGQPFPADMCAADRTGSDLGCTANDIDIAAVTVNNGVTSCVAGASVTLDLSVNLQLNANQRYDIGVFVARDGESPIIRSNAGGSASCSVFGLPTSPPPLANLDGNACGDIGDKGAASIHIGTVTVPCTPDAAGRLVLPAAVTWDNNSSLDVLPGTTRAMGAGEHQIAMQRGHRGADTVTVTGRITVVKETTPSGSPGSSRSTPADRRYRRRPFRWRPGNSRCWTRHSSPRRRRSTR